jgi:hypothetical protein
MRRILAPALADRAARFRLVVLSFMVALASPGCRHDVPIEFIGAAKPLTVQLLRPQVRKIVRVVGQPSFIESYERTSIYAKPTAYILKWIVDIGDKVKKGDVLANLFAPELIEELGTKKANVVLDQERITLAKEVVDVAAAEVKAAGARVKETEAILVKFQSEVDRWDTEVKRLERQVSGTVVNTSVLFESINQLKSSIAALEKAKATIKRAKAELIAAEARHAKAQVDVRVMEADLKVADSTFHRRHHRPQRQHVRFRPACHRRPNGLLPVAGHFDRGGRADLCGRPSRHCPDLCRHPRTRCQLRQHRHKGDRVGQGVPRYGAAGHRHARFLGAQPEESHASRRDRP